jgi:hypothetical protein
MIKFWRFFVSTLLTLPVLANAQRCGATCASPEAILGLSEQTLVATIPELKRTPKPMPGPRNSRGKWMLPDVTFASQAFSANYFILDRRVSRIEYLSTATKLQCLQRTPFELALSELAGSYGESHAAGSFNDGGRSMQSVSFNTQDMDIAVHLSLSAEDCSTRVIFKTRVVKDASEL